jgi:hypothetical protein
MPASTRITTIQVVAEKNSRSASELARMGVLYFVMPGLVPGIHVFFLVLDSRRGWPGQARP